MLDRKLNFNDYVTSTCKKAGKNYVLARLNQKVQLKTKISKFYWISLYSVFTWQKPEDQILW